MVCLSCPLLCSCPPTAANPLIETAALTTLNPHTTAHHHNHQITTAPPPQRPLPTLRIQQRTGHVEGQDDAELFVAPLDHRVGAHDVLLVDRPDVDGGHRDLQGGWVAGVGVGQGGGAGAGAGAGGVQRGECASLLVSGARHQRQRRRTLTSSDLRNSSSASSEPSVDACTHTPSPAGSGRQRSGGRGAEGSKGMSASTQHC